VIVGAGLAGLIAAHAFPRETIVEARPEPTEIHKALLRFRTPTVGEMTGVEFRPVTVHKGIWLNGAYVEPNILVANLYARKVVGKLLDRSIWRLEPETRWVAPEDLYERLVTAVKDRIAWGVQADFLRSDEPIISTAPMPVALRACGTPVAADITFQRAPITVIRYRVPQASVYQTVYHPSPDHTLYRASITGDLLICEFAGEPQGAWLSDVVSSMHLPDMERLSVVSQEHGKIAPIDEAQRKAFIVSLTELHRVFSLGRFATWRNVLLDDVVHDIAVIKRLITATSYDRRLIAPY
jgi:hypothetical protein